MAKAAYGAFLRGVSPMNAKMPALRKALEEAAIEAALKRPCLAIVRPLADLQALIDADPYKRLKLPANAKRIVTFLNEEPAKKPKLPLVEQQAGIYAMKGLEIFSAYVPQPGNPFFMVLLERTFGKEITTRTWDTVKKVVASQVDNA